MSVIECNKLTKDFGKGCGIFDLDLQIEEGEMVGFVGTNGSGKTTTIRNILGFLKPTSGQVSVNGLSPVVGSSKRIREASFINAATRAVFCFIPLLIRFSRFGSPN